MYVRGQTEAGEIRADLDQCLQFPVLLGSDDHPCWEFKDQQLVGVFDLWS